MPASHEADTAVHVRHTDSHAKHWGPVPPEVYVKFGAASHPGLVRPTNQDHFAVVERRRLRTVLMTNLPEGSLPPHDNTGYVMVVADGLGGEAFGELASMLALRTGWEMGPTAIKWSWIVTDQEVEDLKDRLEKTFRRMDRALLDQAKADPRCAGMGTTLTGAFTVGPEAFIAHVGDSRAYLFHADCLNRLTRDHTVAQRCLDMGLPITKKSWFHTLTNCLGSGEGMYLEFHHFHLSDGDQILLCTDGLTDMVPDEEIARLLGRHKEPQETAQVLVDMALANGGRDNVTVVLAQYATPDSDAAIE